MALWSNLKVGDPILSESHFADGFRDDFDTLDLETSSAPGNRTGKWKKGFLFANMTRYGLTFGSDENPGDNFVHAAINNEEQVYVDTRKPPPSGVNPYSVNDGVLTITSAPVREQDRDWARVKDAYKNADGTNGQFARNKPVKYTSGMISTYGRFAMSFGRFRARLKTPYGANGASADIRQRSAIFPAGLWTLMDVPYGCDINGNPFGDGQTTYRGARPNGSGNFYELDADENFGESRTSIHQTIHEDFKGNAGRVSKPNTVPIGKDLRSAWRESGMDVFPGKVAFFVDGRYTVILPLSDELLNGLFAYEPQAGREYDPVMLSPGTAKTLGRQTHPNGSTRYMCHVMIANLARDGKYPRDLARQIHERGEALPPHTDTCSMEIDWMEARPLIDENPDDFPLRFNGVPTALDGSTTTLDGGTGSNPNNPGGGGTIGGGNNPIVQARAQGYVPELGTGIRFRPSHDDGIVEYELMDPVKAGAGRWRWDDYAGATLIGDDTSPLLRLRVPDVAEPTERGVWWEAA